MGVMQTETRSHLVPLSQHSRQTVDYKHVNAAYYQCFGLQPEHCIPAITWHAMSSVLQHCKQKPSWDHPAASWFFTTETSG